MFKYHISIKLILLLTCWFFSLKSQDVRLNEIMTLNTNIISDEDGSYPDWLEIYNSGTQAVNLSGYGLSDDLLEPQKWLFPEVVLNQGEYLLVFASGKDRRYWIKHWETIINQGDSWRYLPGTSQPPADWFTTGFDDNSWMSGPSGFGYGDGDDNTVLSPVMSVYLRTKINLTDTAEITALLLHIDYDDAFVAYLNGIEIARSNIGTPGTPPPYNQGANDWREAEIYQGGIPESYQVSQFIGLLKAGENVLAIQVHNYDANSSDMSAIPFFTLGLNRIPENAHGVPEILNLGLPRLHTNFKLDADGEAVFITTPDSLLVDSLYPGIVPGDMSFGRQPDGAENLYLFPEPTPGESNSTPGYPGIAVDPEISLPAGIYDNPVTLSLTPVQSGLDIYYTLDGSEPDESSPKYSGPLSIQSTVVIRARAYATGYLPSKIITASYLIGENFQLPVVSLTTDPQNLWDEETGIYVMGPNAEPDFPYHGANFWQDWERPVHVEFFEMDGVTGFNADAGVKITGGWSRAFAQKSLAIFFRRRYGLAEINYQLFPELSFFNFKSIVLRNSGNDWESTLMRDGVMAGLAGEIDIDHQAFRPVVVFLNSEYWGIHNLREKANEEFLATHHTVDPAKVDILEWDGQIIEGTSEHYDMMKNYLQNNDIRSPEVYANVSEMMDIDNFINYQVAQIYCDNTDWPGNNIKYWRPQTAQGRWRWIIYDTDFGFGLYDNDAVSHNTLEFATEPNGPEWPNPPWSTYMLRRLLENEQFKIKFINAFADHLNTVFSGQNVMDHIDSLKSIIKNDMTKHLQRWGRTYQQWEPLTTGLKAFAAKRPENIRSHIQNKFALSGQADLTIINSSAPFGKIKLNSIEIKASSWQGIYFNDIPIKLTAVPQTGYRFVGWSGDVIDNTDSMVITMSGDMEIHAGFVQDTSVVINEINYNSSADFPVGDWIEFYNSSVRSIDVSNWQFLDSDDAHVFQFPGGTVLQPDSFVVICRDSALFTLLFPQVKNIAGFIDFGLNNGGELLRLYDNHGRVVDSLTYSDMSPWPVEPDGTGATLILKNALLDNSQPENWIASSGHGTPGKPNQGISSNDDLWSHVPLEYRLGQNYPNPFNPVTHIPVTIAQKKEIRLIIYDITGRVVETLIHGYPDPGKYVFKWSPGNEIAAGIYFYRLEIQNSHHITRKLIYLK